MTTSTIQSVTLLPIYFQSTKNSKFLSSTIDQLINPAQLERLNAYIGSTATPTYSTSDSYIVESSPLRQTYQLDPALITYDINGTVQSVVAIDDLVNEISIEGGLVDNFDRLFRSQVYSYYPEIDWDKLVNYENYYWLPTGPTLIDIDQDHLDVDNLIVGNPTATVTVSGTNVTLLNGMLVSFSGRGVSSNYLYKDFFVEGTGTSIVLVPLDSLITPESVAATDSDFFDSVGFDTFSFDNNRNIPITPEYVTINRASTDRNPWSRYNRWVSAEVIAVSAGLNNQSIKYPSSHRAVRPIVEFNANIQLYNFGSVAIPPVDLIDTTTVDAFNTIEGTTIVGNSSTATIMVDGIYLEYGQRIIFSADNDPLVRNYVYQINIFPINGVNKLTLLRTNEPAPPSGASVLVTKGNTYGGTSWRYDGSNWLYAQQHTTLNGGPLFDLFDNQGNSYSDKTIHLANFTGNKIFGYQIGTGTVDPVLGFPLSYRNTNAVGSFLFQNYFSSGVINISVNNVNTIKIPTSQTYFKVGSKFVNVWSNLIAPEINVNIAGYYDAPLGLTNNPLNSNLTSFTLSDLDGQALIRTRLIANANPLAFALMFIGKKSNNVIDAITNSAIAYNYFKLALVTQASKAQNALDPSAALDEILAIINTSKTPQSPYYLTDMAGYGPDKHTTTYTVLNTATVQYPLLSAFGLTTITPRSVLIYKNNVQLIHAMDYVFDEVDGTVQILTPLAVNDIITINDYGNTDGNYIPPTPTKLGLYPAFKPLIYQDTTYANGPVNVIRGHDGSLTVAFNDYRDNIILEYELRVYNNLKFAYRSELFDINSSNPGAFRDVGGISKYSLTEITNILQEDFISWAGTYGIDYTTNPTYDATNPFTWNYKDTFNTLLGVPVNGSWRSVFKYFYDTDQPHISPWEMLGFGNKPSWWDDTYGPAPYTSGNSILWQDLETGNIAYGDNAGINDFYARPGLHAIIPVDEYGNLLDPVKIGLVSPTLPYNIDANWTIGDQSPAEIAWRRSSFWPFAIQRLLALTQPASYASLMYDPVNMNVNISGQWTYGSNQNFLTLSEMPIHGENNIATSGYSVFVSEIGQQRTQNYITELRQDLQYVNFNLFHKVGGFVNKNTLQVIIDAYDPTSTDPGAILPNESYSLILNTSNPIRTIGISGIIVQRTSQGYVIRGYDQSYPYFKVYTPIINSSSPSITVGGVSAHYVSWQSATSVGSTGLNTLETVTAKAAPSSIFYQKGQIVLYGSNYYRVVTSHQAESTFNSVYYQILADLPVTGGSTVQTSIRFNKTEVIVPYGTTYSNIQDVYNLIIGYGEWLTDQGFVFDQFNSDLNTTVDWYLSGKEFLYWTTQNWNNNTVISLSPFADQLTYQYNDSVVDNIFNSFYQYSILKSDGTPFDKNGLFVTRQSGQFTLNVINTQEGVYFARLNSVQKEHGMVFDNTSIFGDVIYDIETGERQHRMKLVGFRTSNWNGDFFAPGFVYDEALVKTWKPYTNYLASDVVQYTGLYYSAIRNVRGGQSFDFNQWNKLGSKPVAGLLPNFDYKITQFKDFYSLDIDNFDANIQQAAQNLTGYLPRTYLNNIFTDPIAQYKFYQGYIKEKGTMNPINKLGKASIQNLNSQINFYEDWAFRVGQYGSFRTYHEFETPLIEGTFSENPQLVIFTNSIPSPRNEAAFYVTPDKLTISDTGTIPQIATTTSDNIFKLIHSGYVQINDVDLTAYNHASLLDIANNNVLNENATIWLGFTDNGDWDVYRYTLLSADVIAANVDTIYNQITITTSNEHNLSAGQLISIVQINPILDGIYTILQIVSKQEFIIANINNYLDTTTSIFPGLLYVFESTRFDEFDNIPSDQILQAFDVGTKIWVDSGNGSDNNGWAVYEKVINHNSSFYPSYSVNPSFEGLGYSISRPKGSKVAVVGAPTFEYNGNSGNIVVYEQSNSRFGQVCHYTMAGSGNKLGHAVVYDDMVVDYSFTASSYGLIFAGAPGYNSSNGYVRISLITKVLQEHIVSILKNPIGIGLSSYFGSSIYVQKNTSTKTVLIGAPSSPDNSINYGNVWKYIVTSTNSFVSSNPVAILPNISLRPGDQWGYAIVGSDDATYYAISAPTSLSGTGTVITYIDGVATDVLTTSTWGGQFGKSMAMSPDGSYLAIGAPNTYNSDNSLGLVAIYTLTNVSTTASYQLNQIIYNPVPGLGMHFGQAIDFNTKVNKLIITAVGTDTSIKTIFDGNTTIFDLDSTKFIETDTGSGTAYLYSRRDTRFVFSEEVTTSSVYVQNDMKVLGTDYGTAVTLDDDFILVGGPSITGSGLSGVYKFDTIDPSIVGWNQIHAQDDLVLSSAIQKVMFVNTASESVINYYDYVDPIKGKILGIADQELTYLTASDPAIYSIGTTATNVSINPKFNWLDDHVGELWWDLSTAKFIWYEQDTLEYRKNNWGKLFPGASIDVYEWVGSQLLPSDWSSQADTSEGLTQSISGQPKFVDNSTISIKQVYDPVSNSFSNVYYYWVKNKVTIPNIPNRRISSYSVASYIADPTSSGIEYVAFLSSSSMMLSNLGNTLVSNHVSLNIAVDNTNSKIPRHTEWMLMQEGLESSTPPAIFEKKLLDSLIGHDSLGNLVPDPSLSERSKYGIGIRPQQTLFRNRFSALRNLVGYINNILIDKQITSNYSFANLNAQEPYPTGYTTIEDVNELTALNTSTAVVLSDSSSNGGWTLYQYQNNTWVRSRTQSYNTPLYWNYKDWVSPDYNTHQLLTTVVDDPYQLNELSLTTGQYAKVKNRGDGNYIIVEQVSTNTIGNYGNNFNLIYIQNGTIQIGDNIWDLAYGWDETYSFNQPLFDQTPDIEIEYIFKALKNDLFINELKVNWNQLFFAGIKYALTEQPTIDWVFKTTFIDIVNNVGPLTQPPVYKLQDSSYYEDFINEIKPYHTQIREFTVSFNSTETVYTNVSDFDAPSYYNTTTNNFVPAIVSATYVTSNPVREIKETIVFDRITTHDQIGELPVVDKFIADGVNTVFQLSWLAQADKSKISVAFNQAVILPSDFTIEYYTNTYNGYTKQYNNLVLTGIVPTATTIVSINYQKSVEIMSAVERINNFYSPTEGMPGNSLDQLMIGAIDPRKTIGGQYEGFGFGDTYNGMTPDSLINPSSGNYPTWNAFNLVNALGVSPTDITLDGGYNFISQHSGVAPEELIPGFTADTLGIDVYTQPTATVPFIINGSFNINSGTTVIPLTTLPPTSSSMIVIYNNNLRLSYSGNFPKTLMSYGIDIIDHNLIVNTPPNGTVSYTIVGVGDSDTSGSGLISYVNESIIETETNNTATILSSVVLNEVKSIYVTVDFSPIGSVATTTNAYYVLGQLSETDTRATVYLYNLKPRSFVAQAWFFNSSQKNYDQILEQTQVVFNNPLFGANSITGYLQSLPLTYSPSTIGPPSSQVIVEIYDQIAQTTIRLRPPYVKYYTVTTTNTTTYLALDNDGTFVSASNNVNVYHNGQILTAGTDFTVNGSDVVTIINTSSMKIGDTIAVESFVGNDVSKSLPNFGSSYSYDFMITGNQLLLSPNYANNIYFTLKITTFANQDSLNMQQKEFIGNPNRTYVLDRPVLNSNYLWITANQNNNTEIYLSNGIDYEVLEDKITILLSDKYNFTFKDTVFITSFANPTISPNILGYRIFNDFLGGTKFTRLSNKNSTYLIKPLQITDTEIYVADASVLSPPDVITNTPGVVLIDGERIEFFNNTNNILSQLRRGTLGTSPQIYLEQNTVVLDQGNNQTIPQNYGVEYTDTILVQNTYTDANLDNTYYISTSTITGWVNPYTSATIRCDGITFATTVGKLPYDPYTGNIIQNSRIYSVTTASLRAEDQIQVYYGGYPLHKDYTYQQDTTVSYDGVSVSQIVGSVPTAAALTTATIYLGNAYLCEDTNEIWVCTENQFEFIGVPNFVDSGLRKIAPDFTVNTSTQQLILNTATVNIQTGTMLTIVKVQAGPSFNDIDPNNTMTNTISILNSQNYMATFLKEGPAVLPNSYFYGGDTELITNDGSPLLDENGNIIQGF